MGSHPLVGPPELNILFSLIKPKFIVQKILFIVDSSSLCNIFKWCWWKVDFNKVSICCFDVILIFRTCLIWLMYYLINSFIFNQREHYIIYATIPKSTYITSFCRLWSLYLQLPLQATKKVILTFMKSRQKMAAILPEKCFFCENYGQWFPKSRQK